MRYWAASLAIVLLFCAAFVCLKAAETGDTGPGILRTNVAPVLRKMADRATDIRFRLRGAEAPLQKVVIVEVDSPSLAAFGRWPWHRDAIGALIQGCFEAGAQVVGLDMVFSEADPRTPEPLRAALQEKALGDLAAAYETDPLLVQVIAANADKLVLGWQSESVCQPGLEAFADCPVTEADYWRAIGPLQHKFAVAHPVFDKRLQAQQTPLPSAVTVLPNLDLFAQPAKHAGYFNAFLDPDGVIRSTHVLLLAAGKLQPSLPLAMAAAALHKPLVAHVDATGRLLSAGLSGLPPLPLDALGRMRIRFYGPGRTFPYVSAEKVLNEDKAALAQLKGAHVLIGLSALGVHDMRNFPFDHNVPGVEGQATILDNLLSGNAFLAPAQVYEVPVVLLLMGVFALLLAFALHRLQALAGLATFAAAVLAVGFADMQFFRRSIFYDTGLLYFECAVLLAVCLAIKYFDEENKKKFLRSAFAHYVSPALVDQIVQDPSQLTLGGDKRPVSVLFSDIRGFTSFSERLDAKELVAFLNSYLGQMTDVVFVSHGTLDKYIGDAVMAFWGAPIPQADHAARAVAAALRMQVLVAAMRAEVQQKWGIDLQVGIGIASGVVNVGNMGSAQKFEFTVIGDRVNLASRLESLTKTYGAHILTTQETLAEIRATGGTVPLHRQVDRVCVKGKHDAVELVEILTAAVDPVESQALAGAQKLYEARAFSAAEAAFQALYTQHGHKLYALFAGRCSHFLAHPPAADWQGQWEMDSK